MACEQNLLLRDDYFVNLSIIWWYGWVCISLDETSFCWSTDEDVIFKHFQNIAKNHHASVVLLTHSEILQGII